MWRRSTRFFEKLYADGYIYIGERMVNWSPGFQSVISDIEIDNREEDGFLWHLRYPYSDGSGRYYRGHFAARRPCSATRQWR